tara:strand:- start:1239 stop:1487 length:249 start_codon:yes stop_codon:yes gene_type:complete
MSDRLFTPEELEAEEIKETTIKNGLRAEYVKQEKIIDNLLSSIEKYMIYYGRHSNVFSDLMQLKSQLNANKKALNEFLDVIC